MSVTSMQAAQATESSLAAYGAEACPLF